MPWKRANRGGGGAIVPNPATGIAPATSGKSVTISVSPPEVGVIQSWDLEYKSSQSGIWLLIESNIIESSKVVSGLQSSASYDFRTTTRVQTTTTTVTERTITTPEAPTRILQYSDIMIPHVANAMYVDQEPAENGYSGIGPIQAPGRTILFNYNRLVNPARAAQHRIYGIRFRFGNMSPNQIAGARLICSRVNGWNGAWYPRIDGVNINTITGNLMTGWQTATVGGDPTLPVPAAIPGSSGWALSTVWTDWMVIPSGILMSATGSEFMTRVLLPPRATAPYAITNGAWGSQNWQHMGVLAGRAQVMYDWRSNDNAPRDYVGRVEGDYVTDPTGDMNALAGFTASNLTPLTSRFGPPGPVHTPILEVHYATSLSEVV